MGLVRKTIVGALFLLSLVALVEGSLHLIQWAAVPEAHVSGGQDRGVRDAGDRGDAPAPCLLDVVCLGDSITFGSGASKEEAYPAVLSQRWRAIRGGEARVTNLALPGANSSEQVRRLQEHLEDPAGHNVDLVLVMLGFNNRWNLHEASFWDEEPEAREESYMTYLASKLRLYKLVQGTRTSPGKVAATARALPGEEYNNLREKRGWSMFFYGYNDPYLARWIRRDLLKAAQVARSHGARPIFLTYHYDRFGFLNRLIKDTAREASVTLIDLERTQHFHEKRDHLAEDNMHLNPAGHAHLAARLARALWTSGVRARCPSVSADAGPW